VRTLFQYALGARFLRRALSSALTLAVVFRLFHKGYYRDGLRFRTLFNSIGNCLFEFLAFLFVSCPYPLVTTRLTLTAHGCTSLEFRPTDCRNWSLRLQDHMLEHLLEIS
jgi:hypothetical protein